MTDLYLFTQGHSHILTLNWQTDGTQHQTDNLLHRPMVLLKHVFTLYQSQTCSFPQAHPYSCPQPLSFPEVLVWTTLPNNRSLIKPAENLQQLKTKYLNILFPHCFVDKGLKEEKNKNVSFLPRIFTMVIINATHQHLPVSM